MSDPIIFITVFVFILITFFVMEKAHNDFHKAMENIARIQGKTWLRGIGIMVDKDFGSE